MPKTQKKLSNADMISAIAEHLKQSANRPNIFGYKPHKKQKQFHESQARGRLFIGGNRSGKTVAGACEAVWRLRGMHPFRNVPPAPVRGRAIGVDLEDGIKKIIIPELSRWIPPSDLINGSWMDSYSAQERKLTLANKSFIEFLTYEQDVAKHAGTSRHFFWMDEEPPKSHFNENKARLIDTGGDWWITMTPVDGMTWTFDEIYAKAAVDPLIDVVEVDMTENTTLSATEIDAFISGLSNEEREARVHGRYVALGGLIYPEFDPDIHIIDPFIPDPSEKWSQIAGLDHGINNPTCWLWSTIDPDGRIFVFDEHYKSGQIVSYHAKSVHLKNEEHRRVPDYYVGDPSIKARDPLTGTSVLEEYASAGVPIALGNNDVSTGISRVRNLLRHEEEKPPKLYVTRNCVNTIYEFQRYRWAVWANAKMRDEKNLKEEPKKKDDHAMDTLRYIVNSRPEMFLPMEQPKELLVQRQNTSVSPYRPVLATAPPGRSHADPHLGEEY